MTAESGTLQRMVAEAGRWLRQAGYAALAFVALMGGAVTLAPTAAQAAGEVIVLSTDAAGLTPGTTLAAGDAVNLAEGQSLQVLLGNGTTKTVEGPFAGTAGDLSSGVEKNTSLWSTMTGVLKGGDERSATGAVRSITGGAPAPGAAPSGFSLTMMPAHATGTFCLTGDGPYEVGQPMFLNAPTATLIDLKSQERATVRWTPGKSSAVWPRRVAPQDQSRYMVLLPRLPVRQVEVSLMRDAPDKDAVLAELSRRGCKFQMEAWLRDRLGPDWRPQQ